MELTAECTSFPPVATAIKKRRGGTFTPESSKRANDARKRIAEERKRENALRALAPAPPPVLTPAEEYLQERITCVRDQIERLNTLFAKETDAQKIDRLASALEKLQEMERQLAGRPSAGTLKPRQAEPEKPRALAFLSSSPAQHPGGHAEQE